MSEAEDEVRSMLEGGEATRLLYYYDWGVALMHLYGEIQWMAEQSDDRQMVTAQQFARNLLDDVGK